MKRLIYILLLISFPLSGATYYVSNAGVDTNNGTSTATPWQTIAKVNASTFVAGDQILFRRGDTFSGTLTIPSSGNSSARIVFGAYGTGNDPIFNAFTTISGWTAYGGGIYSKSLSTPSTPNVVTLDGVNQQIGRWPNMPDKYKDIDTYSGGTALTDSELPTTPSLVGAEVVVRSAAWILDRRTILTHSSHTITYANLTYGSTFLHNGNGYFLQNHISLLDVYGEWCYSGTTFYMYFGASGPSGHEVKVSTANTLLSATSRSYITIENLSFQGANQQAIYLSASDYVNINQCNISFSGVNGITAVSDCDYNYITYCDISHSNNIGINYSSSSRYGRIQFNDVSYSGYLIGQGASGDDGYCGVIARGNNSTVQYNSMTYAGYCNLKFAGVSTSITYNYIDYSCLHKDDGGGMYMYADTQTGKVIDHNIVLNTQACDDGWWYYEGTRGNGIYLDGPNNVTVTNNIVAHCDGGGLFINEVQYATVTGNITFDNVMGLELTSMTGDTYARYQAYSNNVFFARTASQSTAAYYTKDGVSEISNFGTSDYNYFCRPISNDNYIEVWMNAWGWAPGDRSYYTLAEWVALSGKDTHSDDTPATATLDNQIHFVLNETNVAKSFTLSDAMVDYAGAAKSGTIDVPAYSATILIGAGTVTEPGVTPPALPEGFLKHLGKPFILIGKFLNL